MHDATIVSLCLMVLTSQVTKLDVQGASSDDRLKALAAGYLENRNSIQQFECEYVVKIGYSNSPQEALSRGPTSDVTRADFLWLKDGKLERYETWREVESLKKRGQGNSHGAFGMMLPPSKRLSDEHFQLLYSGVLKGGTLHSEKYPGPPTLMTPLDLGEEMGSTGELNPGDMARKWLGVEQGPWGFQYGGEVNGLEWFVLTCTDEGAELRISFGLDPDRGFLPIETTFSAGNRIEKKIHITATVELPEKRWFPSRVVSYQPESSPKCSTTELIVSKILPNTPSVDRFAITLPQSTLISNGERNSQIRLSSQKTIRLSDLPTLFDATTAIRMKREGERTNTSERLPLVLVLCGIVLIGVLGGSIYAIRSFRR